MTRIHGSAPASHTDHQLECRAREHFDSMTRAEVVQAVCGMKALGFGDYQIAAACRFSVEMVRELLAERRGASA